MYVHINISSTSNSTPALQLVEDFSVVRVLCCLQLALPCQQSVQKPPLSADSHNPIPPALQQPVEAQHGPG